MLERPADSAIVKRRQEMSSIHTAQLILHKVPRHARRQHVGPPLPGGLEEFLVDGVWRDSRNSVRKTKGCAQADESSHESADSNRQPIAGRRAILAAEVADKSVVDNALPPRQIDAAVLLIGGMIAKDVAEALGVAEETVSRWRRRPEFQHVMQTLLQERYDATRMAMVSLAQDAVEELRCLIHGSNDMTRLRAIELVLGGLAQMRT